jgi:hypothetical protein
MFIHKQKENIKFLEESIDLIRIIDNIVNQINRSSMTMPYLELIKQTLDVSNNPTIEREK